MDIYFDSCCYCRPYDDQTKTKIRAETSAIFDVIRKCRMEGHRIIGSLAIISELEQIDDDDEKRDAVMNFYFDTVDGDVRLSAQNYTRSDILEADGLGDMDSLHLAAAETAGATFLLTTDKNFIKICANKNLSIVKVINPLNF